METGNLGKNQGETRIPELFGAVEIQRCREGLLTGGLTYTAGLIAATCAAVYIGLSALSSAEGLAHPPLGQTAGMLALAGMAVFVIFAGLMFPLSRKTFQRLETALRSALQTWDKWPAVADPAHATPAVSAEHSLRSPDRSRDRAEEAVSTRSLRSSDVSPRPRAVIEDQDMRSSLALLTSIIDNLPQCVFCKDLDGKYSFANTAFRNRVGLPADKIIGQTDFASLPRGLADHEIDRRVVRGQSPMEAVIQEELPSGETHYLHVIRAPRFDDAGNAIGIQGMFWDITERKVAEQALARERDLLAAIMNSTMDNIYFKDRESRFIRINKTLAKLFGLKDPAEAIGKTDFDFFTGGHANEAFEDEQRIIRTGTPLVDVEEKETWPDKEDTWASTTKQPLIDSTGQVIGTFGITRDITNRKRSEAAFQRALSDVLDFVSKVSEGDLTLRAKEGDDTLGMVARSINKMLDRFSEMLANVKQLGLLVSSSASQILVAADEIANGSQKQTDETTSITSAVEEMAASMLQVSRNAEASATAAQRALYKAEGGAQSVQDASEAMERINSAVERTSEKMKMLAARSSEISEIMGLINDVAAQTNLLSLNAAIEAAHAGDAGAGFSVVAEEIRKLAERSANATRDVSKLVQGIQ
ncbi:MAG TPA: PAS domain-containing protein, partial [Blastocatellia bacterium]|nr:PAS domain-containing protein [Blastocatellia bacterium]